METIPQQLKRIRTEAGKTQKDVGDIIGVTAAAISFYEGGYRPIRARDFEKIKKALTKEDFP